MSHKLCDIIIETHQMRVKSAAMKTTVRRTKMIISIVHPFSESSRRSSSKVEEELVSNEVDSGKSVVDIGVVSGGTSFSSILSNKVLYGPEPFKFLKF